MRRSKFTDSSKMKIDFMSQIIRNENISKALLYNTENFLDGEFDTSQSKNLIYTQIFPYQRIPDINDEAKTFISMSFNYGESKSSEYYKWAFVTFYIFCHKSLIKTKYNITRYDFIIDELDYLIGSSKSENWIGNMEFVGAKDGIFDEKGNYYGVEISYQNVGFS